MYQDNEMISAITVFHTSEGNIKILERREDYIQN